MGGVHGDERLGVRILERLKKDMASWDIKGELNLVMGNPLAYEKNVRFVDCDLNRLFGEDWESLASLKNPNYEQKRAMEIGEILKNADFLLDIHSTRKPSVPFLYMENEEKYLQFAKLFGVKFVVSPEKDFRTKDSFSSADNFVDRNGGIGFTYESGWQKDDSTEDSVYNSVLRFLKAVGTINIDLPAYSNDKFTHLEVYNNVIADKNDFSFAHDYSNFDKVKSGDTIADEDSYIIFPRKEFKMGQVACYLAHKI